MRLLLVYLWAILLFAWRGIAVSNRECQQGTYNENYGGSVSRTVGGKTCQHWGSLSPHFHWYTGWGPKHGNKCRNFFSKEKKPWCYTTDSSVRWDYCDIPYCDRTECYSGNGISYIGKISKTKSGRTCQRWDSQSPHKHSWGSLGSGNVNYCRNPDFEAMPWCYTTDRNKKWEYCDVTPCTNSGECLVTEKGTEYKGHKATTKSGKACITWRAGTTTYTWLHSQSNYCRNPDLDKRPWCHKSSGWEFCYIPPCAECLSDAKGVNYRGKKTTTRGGKTCQRWDLQKPHKHSYSSYKDQANYCRNIKGDENAPWCYTTDKNKRWDVCDIPSCSDTTTCYWSKTGTDYAGTMSLTKSGKHCQKWSSKWPHDHSNTAIGSHNYCRNPEDSQYPWCYTTDQNKRWEYCQVPQCSCGDIPANSGTLMSPRYPSNYPDYRTCEWTIQAPAGKRILATLTAIDLQEGTTCTADYLSLLDGPSSSSTSLLRTCGTRKGEDYVESSTNQMKVILHADKTISKKGFQLYFTFTDSTTCNRDDICGRGFNSKCSTTSGSNMYNCACPANTERLPTIWGTKTKCKASCTDFVFVGDETTIQHTSSSGTKSGIVLMDTVSKTDNSVYFVDISSSCSAGYDCVTVKKFASYDELKTKNEDSNWPKVYLKERCWLPTIRVFNGVLYCQIGSRSSSEKKPVIVKASLSTGEMLSQRQIATGKDDSVCLKSSTDSGRSHCTGTSSHYTVHMLVDETGFWIVYKGDQTVGGSDVIELIEPSDLSVVYRKELGASFLGNKELPIVICNKLYKFAYGTSSQPLRMTKVIDLANPSNTFAHTNKIRETWTDMSNKWIHYNAKTEELFVGSAVGNSMKYKAIKCRAAISASDLNSIESTLVWSLRPSEFGHYKQIIRLLKGYYKIKSYDAIKKITPVLLSCPDPQCSISNHARFNNIDCQIKRLLNDLQLLAVYRHALKNPNAAKVLQTSFYMKELLQQQFMRTISTKIDNLLAVVNTNFDNIKHQINTFKQDLGKYFENIATFDGKESTATVKFLYNRIDQYKQKVNEIQVKLAPKFTTLFFGATTVIATNLAQKLLRVGVAASAFANPIETISEGAGSMLALLDAIDEAARAAVPITQLVFLKEKIFPELRTLANTFKTHAEDNFRELTAMKELTKAAKTKTLTNEQVAKNADEFLRLYDAFDPRFMEGDIESYGTKMASLVEQLCDNIKFGDSVASTPMQHIFENSGDCMRTNNDVAKLKAIYTEMYSFTYQILDALAKLVRSSISAASATKLQDVEQEISKAVLQNNEVQMNLIAMKLYSNSEIHGGNLVRQACDLIEYHNAGKRTDYCQTTLENLHSSEYDKIVAFPYDKDICDRDAIEKNVNIPAQSRTGTTAVPEGIIDITALYNGETVSFRIPDKQWLVRHKWVDAHDVNKPIYISKFNLMLPIGPSGASVATVGVTNLGSNPLVPKGKSYAFEKLITMNYRYQANTVIPCHSTVNERKNPYEIQGCPTLKRVCTTSEGTDESKPFHPSAFADWKIHAHVSDNMNMTKVKDFEVVGTMYLQAHVRLCIEHTQHVTARRRQTATTCCANSNKYHDLLDQTTPCKSCPAGSCPKLNGYYCGKPCT